MLRKGVSNLQIVYKLWEPQAGQLFCDLEEKEENEQMVNEEDEQGNISVYPAWSKKNAPKDKQNKWEVPIYM